MDDDYKSHSGQDRWVLEKVRRGFFVEMGAMGGIYLSNTYVLEKKFNWDGILIEGNPRWWNKLTENRGVKCMPVCAGEKYGIEKFILASAESGLASKHFRKNTENRNSISVATVPLADILDAADCPDYIDYFSLDVEGAEYSIMKDFPFHRFRFGCITVERPPRELMQIFSDNGYDFDRVLHMDVCLLNREIYRTRPAEKLTYFENHRLKVS